MQFKYGALIFSGFLGLSIVLASCGARGKFDQVDDGKIKLASSLTSRSASAALQKVVEKYNKVKGVNDYPIEITQIAGGYDGGRTDLQTRVSVKDKTSFYNMILNYPDLVSVLARNGMELPFDGVNVDKLSPNFLKFNERISGVAKKANYAIPISMSTDILILNAPVLHYILNSAKKNDGNTKVQVKAQSKDSQTKVKGTMEIGTDESTKNLWSDIQKKAGENGKATTEGTKKAAAKSTHLTLLTKSEQSTQGNNGASESDKKIEETWGTYSEVDGGLKNYTFKADVFDTWHGLIDFSTRVAKSFKNKVSDISTKKGTDIQGVLGLDSTPNALFTSVFAAGDSNFDNFFYKVKDGRADFSNFNENGTSYKNLEKVFNDYKKLTDSNGLFVNKGGSYTSNFQKSHQLAYSISSSSGYAYAFAGENSKRLKFNDDTFIEYPSFTQEIHAPGQSSQKEGGQQQSNSKDNGNLLGTFTIEAAKSKTKTEVKKTEDTQNQGKKAEGTPNQGKKAEGTENQGKTIFLYKTSIPNDKQDGVDAVLIKDK